MAGKLDKAIQQTRPYRSRREEALLTIARTAEALGYEREHFFRETAGITATQYNALRILRGAGPDGLPCQEIGRRMVQRVPDVTRLLDRMEQAGLIARERPADDRRIVLVRLTAAGRKLVDRLDEPLDAEHRRLLAGLGEKDLATLIALLDRASPE